MVQGVRLKVVDWTAVAVNRVIATVTITAGLGAGEEEITKMSNKSHVINSINMPIFDNVLRGYIMAEKCLPATKQLVYA